MGEEEKKKDFFLQPSAFSEAFQYNHNEHTEIIAAHLWNANLTPAKINK